MKYTVGSLFAGIGGICLGFKQAKIKDAHYEVVWANEIDEYACQTYRTNFDHYLLEGDINKILKPEEATEEGKHNREYYQYLKNQLVSQKIDILNGGFPCQAFSIAGDRKGFEDDRGNLFWSIINTVKLLEEKHEKPRVLFLENVKNLVAHDGGKTYKVIKSEIEKLGYTVKECVLNTMNFTTLPQNRERIYILCFRDKVDADAFTMFDFIGKYKLSFNKKDREKEIKEIIDYDKKALDKYYYTKEKYPHYFMDEADCNDAEARRINLAEDINEMKQFYQLRRGMYVRKNKSDVCPTLTANMGTGGHNVPLIKVEDGVRKLTPSETLRLQGFPVGHGYMIPVSYKGRPFADSYLYKQAGNAVSVPVIKLIAEELLNVLRANDKKKNKKKG